MKLKEAGKNILIKPWELPNDPNAIQIAKAVPDELCFGEIVNVGPMVPNFEIRAGKIVLIAKDAGEEVEFGGERFKVIQENHVLQFLCLTE